MENSKKTAASNEVFDNIRALKISLHKYFDILNEEVAQAWNLGDCHKVHVLTKQYYETQVWLRQLDHMNLDHKNIIC